MKTITKVLIIYAIIAGVFAIARFQFIQYKETKAEEISIQEENERKEKQEEKRQLIEKCINNNIEEQKNQLNKLGVEKEISKENNIQLQPSNKNTNSLFSVKLVMSEQAIKQLKEVFEKRRQELLHPKLNPLDVTEPSNTTIKKLEEMLDGTRLKSLARTFLLAEKTYNVNAIFLMSIVSLESGFGESERANNGSNNLTGHAVYSNKSRGTQFDSWDDCVLATAKLLKESYIADGAIFKTNLGYDGKSIQEINKMYCMTPTWYKHIQSIANDYINKIN